jgi:GABA(A) receptor-associated protein
MIFHFKSDYSLNDRWKEASKVIEKYKDRVPIICERSSKASYDCPDIDKKKYLVPRDLTIGQFMYVIRKRLKLPAEKAIYLFINGIIPSSSHILGELYEYYKDPDLFLYIQYSYENTFG